MLCAGLHAVLTPLPNPDTNPNSDRKPHPNPDPDPNPEGLNYAVRARCTHFGV